LFGNRPHGIHIDQENNIWISDGSSQTVVKVDQMGKVLLTLGTKNQAGNWDEAAGTRLLNQPNDVAIGRNGDIFLAQGHTPGPTGDPRILKFDKTGKFIKSWGGRGTEPGKFRVAHGIAVDAKGQLWVTDRENSRIQIFDQDGTFLDQWPQFGSPSGIFIAADDTLYVVDYNDRKSLFVGSARDGSIAATSDLTLAEGIAVDRDGAIYVGETVTGHTVRKLVKAGPRD
jgi:DNA-binding beta-propeller fold protein YncE